jgi:hypothetical protein
MERIVGNYPVELSRRLEHIINLGPLPDRGPSWIVDFTLRLLNRLSTMGSPARALDHLTKALTDMRTLLVSMRNTARPLEALSYVIPPVFAGVLYIGRSMVNYMVSAIGNSQYTVVGLTIPDPGTYLLTIALVTYVTTLGTSLLASFFSNWTLRLTIRNTLPLATATPLLVITMYAPTLG